MEVSEKSNDKDIKCPQIVSNMDKPFSDLKELGMRPRAVFRQVFMAMIVNLSVVTSGMSLGYPAIALSLLTDPTKSNALTFNQASWFASINAISSPLGGILSAYLIPKIGRKNSILTVNLSAILSWLIMSTAFHKDNLTFFIQIMIARFIIGITLGMSNGPCGIYSAEISHPNLRGRLTLGSSIGTAAGILIIYIMGYFIRDDWNLINILCACFSVFALLINLRIPESPVYLLTKKQPAKARKVLRYFRGLKSTDNYCYEEIENEFNRIQKSCQHPAGEKKKSFFKMLKQPEVWKPLVIMNVFFAFQQLSGIFIIIVYAVQFSIEAGVEIDPLLMAILIGLTRVITTILFGFILDKWGRRQPALISCIGMTICMMLLTGSAWFPALGEIPYLSVSCIIIYIFTSTFGLMTLPFSMLGEVFPQKVRGQCAGITISVCSILFFIVVNQYPYMVDQLGKEMVFGFFGLISFLAIGFIYFFLPETKGKTLHEIEEYFIYGKNGKILQKSSENEVKEVFV